MVLLVPQQEQDVDELYYCINYITLPYMIITITNR
jgi:hypothetical protein